nr:sialin isoform X2 [Parasteatoda tepidariorum]
MPGIRYLFSTAGFLGFCTIYAIRVNINVAIVAMVNGTAVYKSDNATTSDECKVTPPPFSDNSSLYDVPKEGEFIWSPQLQAVVLGAFYYGYCISQIPGGRLAEIFSAKWVFGIGTFITALLTLLTPAAARMHVGVLIGIRTLEGLAQGVTMPAMHSMLGRWLPDSERAFLSTIVYCGINVGTVSAMPVSGILCNSDIFGGWPSAFYIVGIFGCIWFLLWSFLVTETPHTHPWISKEELKHITSDQKIELKDDLPPIPWFKIMTSVPFWALIITQIGADWAFYTLVNDLPTFFATMLHFNVAKNGFLSSFPHLLQTFFGLVAGFLADFMVQRKLASTNFVRKFFNSLSGFGPALSLVAVCLAGCDVSLNVIFFTLSLSLGGFCYSGYMLSHLDLSPEYAGTLMGIANTISNLTGFLAPLVVGTLTENQQTLHQWRIVFGISAILLMFTSLIFLFFSSTKKQDWAERNCESRILINNSKTSLNGRTSYDSVHC